MALESHRYLPVWRSHRGLTQDQVVDRLTIHEDKLLPTSKAQLSKIGNGKSPYSQRVIEALAEIYECEPWELLGRDPTKEGQVIDMFRNLAPNAQARAEAYISGLADAKDAV